MDALFIYSILENFSLQLHEVCELPFILYTAAIICLLSRLSLCKWLRLCRGTVEEHDSL